VGRRIGGPGAGKIRIPRFRNAFHGTFPITDIIADMKAGRLACSSTRKIAKRRRLTSPRNS
jgi:hypothetical protein